MTTDLQPFEFRGDRVRVLIDDLGESWWVLADVCAVLGISNSRNVAARLDADERGVHETDTLGGRQSVTTVNEPGLYAVVNRSNSPFAKPFQRWVNHVVLPSIRRNGFYAPAVSPSVPEVAWARLVDRIEELVAARIEAALDERLSAALQEGFDRGRAVARVAAKIERAMVRAGGGLTRRQISNVLGDRDRPLMDGALVVLERDGCRWVARPNPRRVFVRPGCPVAEGVAS
ncbi:MAG: hypothetical protein LBK54_01630 [Propionibacteriaceae bacterium]|jgi:prophage antirepressor-like protein|nr:hypothetical protein [Propionibacteriaceae bacterium]